jgi:hypothetical protein
MWVLGGWVKCVNNKRAPRHVVITTTIIMGKLKCRRTKGTRIILAWQVLEALELGGLQMFMWATIPWQTCM